MESLGCFNRLLSVFICCGALLACSATNGTTGSEDADDSSSSSVQDVSGSSGSNAKGSSGSSGSSNANSSAGSNSAGSSSSSGSQYSSSEGGVSSSREFKFIEENEEMLLDLHKMEMTDKRDGQVYKVYASGNSIYLGRNLNYETEDSWCYNDYPENCLKFGRLYTWYAAMTGKTDWCDESDSISICPKGWFYSASGVNYGGYTDGAGGYFGMGEVCRTWSYLIPDAYDKTRRCDIEDGYVRERYSPDSMDLIKVDRKFGAAVMCYFKTGTPPDSVKLPARETVARPEPPILTKYSGPYGELIDERDGNIYKTVKIGNQTWMAENLRYASDSSFCYERNCAKYEYLGRFYKLQAALGMKGYNFQDTAKYPIQGVCPTGWHVPSYEEWMELFVYVAGQTDGFYVREALYTTERWGDPEDLTTREHAGYDAFGLNIYGAGCRIWNDAYRMAYTEHCNLRSHTFIMASTLSTTTHEYYVRFASPEEDPWVGSTIARTYYPNIRCVQGNGNYPVPAVQDSTAE